MGEVLAKIYSSESHEIKGENKLSNVAEEDVSVEV